VDSSGVINVPQLLPVKKDEQELEMYLRRFQGMKCYFVLLQICRVLVKYLEIFQNAKNSVIWHIPHRFSSEMSKTLL
jgi:hypothetical protein